MHESIGQQRDSERLVFRRNRRWKREDCLEAIVIRRKRNAMRSVEARSTVVVAFGSANDVRRELFLAQFVSAASQKQRKLCCEIRSPVLHRRGRDEKHLCDAA